MNNRGRSQNGKPKVVRNTKEQKAKSALTPTKFVPREDPPERMQRQTLRRVLQISVAQAANKIDVKGSAFISAPLGTSGYSQINVKKVSAWSSAGTVSTTLQDMPQLVLQAHTPGGVLLEPDFVDRSSQANRRAKAGYLLPERYFGPFGLTSSICTVSTSGVPATSLVVVEIDAELCWQSKTSIVPDDRTTNSLCFDYNPSPTKEGEGLYIGDPMSKENELELDGLVGNEVYFVPSERLKEMSFS